MSDYEVGTQNSIQQNYFEPNNKSSTISSKTYISCVVPSTVQTHDWHIAGVIYALLSGFAKGTSSSMVKLSTVEVPMLLLFLSQLMIFVGALYIIQRKESFFERRKNRFQIFLTSALYFGMAASLFAVKFIPVCEATIIMMSSPLFAMVLGKLFLREPFGWYEIFILIITLIGIVLIIKPGEIVNALQENIPIKNHIIGCSLALTSAVIMALGSIMVRKLKEIHFSIFIFWGGIAVLLCSTTLNIENNDFDLPNSFMKYVISLTSAFTGLLVHMFAMLALKYMNVGSVLIVRSSEVVFVAIYQVFLFEGDLTLTTILGSATICSSIILINTKLLVMKKIKNVMGK